MAIGYNWAEGSYADASWVSLAWQAAATVFTASLARVQIIARAIRTQIIGP